MSGPFAQFNDYDFRHWVAVQAKDGDSQSVHRLFALQTRDHRHSWFDTRNRRNELAGYLVDLDLARDLAEKHSPTKLESVALTCRYALFAAAIRDVSRIQPPELSGRYVKAGVWTREQALTWARLNPDRQSAVKAVRDVLRQETGRSGDEIARMALSAGASIADADNKVLAIAALAEDLPPHLRGQALELVEAEKNEGSRVGGIRALLPFLPYNLRREALAVAKRFKNTRLKANAIAVVAGSLEEPERSETFRLSLQTACDALSQDRQSTDVVGDLPIEWRWQLYEMLDEENYSDARETILFSCLEMLVDEDPDAVWSQVDRIHSWRRPTLAGKVAGAFAKKGRYKDAFSIAASIKKDGGADKIHTIFQILKHTPESEWPQWIEILDKPDKTYFITQLRDLVSESDVPAGLLRKLADTPYDETVRLQARAIISRVLTTDEINDLVNECLAPHSSFHWDTFSDLSPYLSIDQVERTLDYMGEPGFFETTPYKMLLGRLAQLGKVDNALDRVAGLSDQDEHTRAEIFASLAENISPEGLRRVMVAIRPRKVTLDRIQARASLLRWLPEERAEAILAEACRLKNPLDQLRALVDIARGFPAHQIDRVGEALLNALEASFHSPSRDRDKLLHGGFRALSAVLKRTSSFTVAEKAIELACHETWAPEGKLILLMDLASVGDSSPYVTQILAKAFEIAGGNPAHLSIISDDLSKTHSAALEELLSRHKEPEKLVTFLETVASFLSPKGLGEAYERVRAIENGPMRLRGLNQLVRLLPKRQRKSAAAAELARKSDWSRDWKCVVFAAHIFAADAPELIRTSIDDVEISFEFVDTWLQALSAASFSTITGSREPIDKALKAINELKDESMCDAIELLASALDADQIRTTIGRLSKIQGVDIVPAFAALIERAVALEDSSLILECLEAIDNTYTRSDLIQETAHMLPLNVVWHLAAYENHDSDRLAALAARAAELGDLVLTFSLLDKKGGSFTGGEQTYRLVYRHAPLSHLEELVNYLDKRHPFQRADALTELAKRVPRRLQTRLVKLALDAVQAESATVGAVETFQALEPQLKRLSPSEIVRRWFESIRSRSENGREEVLVQIRAFAPTLVSHFGTEVAIKLDDAICLGAQDVW